MHKPEHSKHLIFSHFIQLVSQQEVRDSKFAVRLREEIHKFEKELGAKPSLTLSEIHLIACIGDHGPINVTAISEKTGLTKGSVTRISKKLLKLDLIRRQQLHDNKKEVFFSLTEQGQRLHQIHGSLHEEIEQRFISFLDTYTPEQLAFARTFLKDLLEWDY